MESGPGFDAHFAEPFLDSLYAENDHVVCFQVKLWEQERSDYFILTRKDSILKAYTYASGSAKLQQLQKDRGSLGLIWKTFIQNDLFNIPDEKNIPNFCPEKYRIYNSFTYEFLIFSQGKMKKLSYYDPEYYDNACYGMSERKKVINSAAVVGYVINK